jgi:hypothetical protein
MSRNAPPPFSPQMYGNFQTLPSPTAQPADTRIKPSREWNVDRFLDDVLISVLLCNSAVAENVIVILYNKIAFLSIATKTVGVLAGGVVRIWRSMFPHFTKKRTPQT